MTRFAACGTAALVLLAAACASRNPAPAATMAPSAGAFVGSRWRIVEIVHSGAHVTAPPGRPGMIAFSPDSHLLAGDGVNTSSGLFRLTRNGFRAHDIGTTLVGYAGRDQGVLTQIAAVAALVSGADVTATVDRGRLTLVVSGFTVSCARAGEAANPTAPPSSVSHT